MIMISPTAKMKYVNETDRMYTFVNKCQGLHMG